MIFENIGFNWYSANKYVMKITFNLRRLDNILYPIIYWCIYPGIKLSSTIIIICSHRSAAHRPFLLRASAKTTKVARM